MVVYRDSGTLWIRDLRALTPRKLAGTEGAGQPFWSPKSDYIAYFTQSQLYKISPAGDSISALCRLPYDLWGGGYWTLKGTILFGQGPGGIYEVDDQGGEPRQILKPEKGENWLYWPSLLPDNKLMYVSLKQDNSSEIVVQAAGQRTSVLKRAEFITWASYSSGHVLYQMGSSTQRGIASFSIWALPFDPAKLSATGESFKAVSDGMAPTVSSTGTLVYRTRPEKENRLAWVSRQGKVLGAIGQPQAEIRNPSISPDGQRVAADGADANSGFDIWIHDSRGTKDRITSEFADRRHAVWSPRGDEIAFDSGGSIYIQQLDQSTEARKILALGAVEEIFLNWSHNGQTLLYDFLSPNRSNRDIWYLPLPLAKSGIPLVQTPADEMLPQISPNQRFVLYQSTESGGYLPDIFAVSFPDGKRKTKISISGGTHPRWSPSRKRNLLCQSRRQSGRGQRYCRPQPGSTTTSLHFRGGRLRSVARHLVVCIRCWTERRTLCGGANADRGKDRRSAKLARGIQSRQVSPISGGFLSHPRQSAANIGRVHRANLPACPPSTES